MKPEEVVEMETRLSGRDIGLERNDGRRRGFVRADRLAHRPRRRAGADSRARGDGEEPLGRSFEGAGETRRPEPPDHRGALAARRRSRDAAGSCHRVRRFRRADPPDREQGDQVDEIADDRELIGFASITTTPALRKDAGVSLYCPPNSARYASVFGCARDRMSRAAAVSSVRRAVVARSPTGRP